MFGLDQHGCATPCVAPLFEKSREPRRCLAAYSSTVPLIGRAGSCDSTYERRPIGERILKGSPWTPLRPSRQGSSDGLNLVTPSLPAQGRRNKSETMSVALCGVRTREIFPRTTFAAVGYLFLTIDRFRKSVNLRRSPLATWRTKSRPTAPCDGFRACQRYGEVIQLTTWCFYPDRFHLGFNSVRVFFPVYSEILGEVSN